MHRLRYWNIRMHAMTLWGKDLTPSLLRIQDAAKNACSWNGKSNRRWAGIRDFVFGVEFALARGPGIQDEARFDVERDSGGAEAG